MIKVGWFGYLLANSQVATMLLTELSTILFACASAFTLTIAVYGWIKAAQAAKYAESCAEYVQQANKRSVTLKRVAELETQLTELYDAYHALLSSHKKLRSRIGMREHREKKKTPQNGAQMDDSDRAVLKEQLRDQLRREGRLK